MKSSPQGIIEILHSISNIKINEETSIKEIDFYFNSSTEPMTASEFIPDSFTRQLCELIENYLIGKE